MSYADYKNHAIMSFYQTFPESRCDRNYLKAQLDAHYKCNGKDLQATAGKGGSRTSGSDRE